MTPLFCTWDTNPCGNCIEPAVIDLEEKCHDLFQQKDDLGSPFCLSRLNDVQLEHPVDIGFFDGSCLRPCAVQCPVNRSYARSGAFTALFFRVHGPKWPPYLSWSSVIIVKDASWCLVNYWGILISSYQLFCGKASSFCFVSSSFTKLGWSATGTSATSQDFPFPVIDESRVQQHKHGCQQGPQH